MTAQTRTVNKGRFEDGDTVTGPNYADLVDSFVSIADTTAQVVTSDLQAPRGIFTTEVSSPQINTTEVSASVINATIVNSTTVSASVVNTNDLNVTHVSASSVFVSATAEIGGPLLVGTSAGVRGFVVLSQKTTLTRANSAATTIARVPDGSDILDFVVHVITKFAAAGASAQVGTVNLLIGTPDDDNQHVTIALSAAQVYRMVAPSGSAAAMHNVSGSAAVVMAEITAVGSVSPNTGEAVITTIYTQRV